MGIGIETVKTHIKSILGKLARQRPNASCNQSPSSRHYLSAVDGQFDNERAAFAYFCFQFDFAAQKVRYDFIAEVKSQSAAAVAGARAVTFDEAAEYLPARSSSVQPWTLIGDANTDRNCCLTDALTTTFVLAGEILDSISAEVGNQVYDGRSVCSLQQYWLH